MEHKATPLERAFELAKSGKFTNVVDIKKKLVQENMLVNQVTGRTLMNQIKELIKVALAAQGDDAALKELPRLKDE